MIWVGTVINFLAAFLPTLGCFSPKFPITSLYVLDLCFVLLGNVHIVLAMLDRIDSKTTIRPYHLFICHILHLVINLVTDIPIPDTIEIDVSKLISAHFAD